VPLSSRFALLPDDVKGRYEHEASFYQFGWSHGKEKLKGGAPDLSKGSYYNNPQYDERTGDAEEGNGESHSVVVWPRVYVSVSASLKVVGREDQTRFCSPIFGPQKKCQIWGLHSRASDASLLMWACAWRYTAMRMFIAKSLHTHHLLLPSVSCKRAPQRFGYLTGQLTCHMHLLMNLVVPFPGSAPVLLPHRRRCVCVESDGFRRH